MKMPLCDRDILQQKLSEMSRISKNLDRLTSDSDPDNVGLDSGLGMIKHCMLQKFRTLHKEVKEIIICLPDNDETVEYLSSFEY